LWAGFGLEGNERLLHSGDFSEVMGAVQWVIEVSDLHERGAAGVAIPYKMALLTGSDASSNWRSEGSRMLLR
jgi:hypothetical protein